MFFFIKSLVRSQVHWNCECECNMTLTFTCLMTVQKQTSTGIRWSVLTIILVTILFSDTPKLRQIDVNFALQVILNILNPPAKVSTGSQNNSSTKSAMHHLSISEHGRCSSLSNSHKSFIKYQGNELLITTAYLGNVVSFKHLLSSGMSRFLPEFCTCKPVNEAGQVNHLAYVKWGI